MADCPPYVDTCFKSFRLAGLAFLVAVAISMQITACAVYKNWWPLLTVLLYVIVPMPCLFFGGGPSEFISSRDSGDWADVAKFLTGFSAVGSLAVPAILYHAHVIKVGAMYLEFASFFLLICAAVLFSRASQEDEY